MVFEEESKAITTIRQTLVESFTYFSSGKVMGEATPTVDLTREIFDVLYSLLIAVQQGSDEGQRAFVVDHCLSPQHGVLQALCHFAVYPLSYAPEVLDRRESLQEVLGDLKVQALRCVKGLILLSAMDEESGLASQCSAAIIDTHLVDSLLSNVLASSESLEPLRVAACEVLFAFAFRLPSACQSLIVSNGASQVMTCFTNETSQTVRVFLCSILRLLVTEMAEEVVVALPALVPTFVSVVVDEGEMEDVRAMGAEVLGLALQTTMGPDFIVKDNRIVSDIMVVINQSLADPSLSATLADAFAKLVELLTVTSTKCMNTTFFEIVSTSQAHRILIQNIRRPPAEMHAVAAAARALRHLIQLAPVTHQVGPHIMNHFPSLSVILKAVLDADKLSVDESVGDGSLHHQIASVELAIAVALMLAQSPGSRVQLRRELEQYPAWAASLLSALSRFLNSPTLEYFGSIDIVDVSGKCINELDAVQWSGAGKPMKSSIRALFREQLARVESKYLSPKGGSVPNTAQAAERKAKLTFVLLNYSIDITLSADSTDVDDIAPNTTIGDISVTSPRGGPQFPSRTKAGVKPVLSRQEREEMMHAYDRFDSAFKMAILFARYYSKGGAEEPTYVPTSDGYMVRASQLRNPWDKVVKKDRLRSWAVADVKEGDLFYFAIPFEELTLSAVDAVRAMARKHMGVCKRLLVVTPHKQRGRKWLLQDLLENILPACVDLLDELSSYLDTHGETTVRFPVFLFREKEIHAGERALHSGNLGDVMDQVKYYFEQSEAEKGLNPTITADIDRKIAELRAKAFNPSADIPDVDSDDDEVISGRGHGSISSDSDT